MATKNVPQLRFKGFTEEWVEKELGELCESLKYGLNAAATTYDGINKYIRITDINDETHTFSSNNLTSPNTDLSLAIDYKLKDSDILFARTGASVGKTYLYKAKDGIVYYAGFLIRARIKPCFNSEFVFQNTLTSQYSKFVKITSQRSGQPGINAQEYSTWCLNIPQFAEQKQIGEFFQNIDKLINANQNKLDKLKNIKKACLEKMFPRRGATTPEIRFKGFSGEWEEKKLCKIGDTFTGLSGKTKDDFGHGNAEFITYMNVFTNPIANRYGTEKVEIDNKQNEVKYGDIFFTTSSETPEEVGMSSIWLSHDNNIYLNSFCFGYRLNEEAYPYYIAYLLRSPAIRKKITFLAQGISRYNISKNKMVEISLPFPNKKEQTQIGTFFQNLDNQISKNEQQLEKLKNIKRACLEKMFVNKEDAI